MKRKIIASICVIFLLLLLIIVMKITSSIRRTDNLNSGRDCLNLGKYNDAITAFNKVLIKDSSNLAASIGICEAYTHLGRLTEAEAILLKVMKEEPDNTEVKGLMSRICLSLGRKYKIEKELEKSKEYYIKAKEFDSSNNQARRELIDIYDEQKEFERMNLGIQELIELEPSDSNLYLKLANIYLNELKSREALEILQKGFNNTQSEYINSIIEKYKIKGDYFGGNSSGNIMNTAYYAESDGWVYGRDPLTNKGLYKFRFDDLNKIKLSDDNASFINIIDGWVYYCSDNIYKIRLDGTERTKLNDVKSCGLTVVGEWIYYCRLESQRDDSNNIFSICKIKTDGTGNVKICDDIVGTYDNAYICVAEEWIFYWNGFDNNKLYKIRSDGTGKVKFLEGNIISINYYDNWLYYSSSEDEGKLYKIDINGRENIKVSDKPVNIINIYDGFIYYLESEDINLYNLYKIRLDGTERMKLCNESLMSNIKGELPEINIAGGWIYCKTPDNNYFRVKIDGSLKE